MEVRTLVLGPVMTNCYLLTDSSAPGRALVIDPAYDGAAIASQLERSGLKPEGVLLTHCHFDHMEGLDELIARTGAPLLCPAKDAAGLTDPFYNGSLLLFRYPVTVSAHPARLLHEGDEILFGDEKLTVLETPGHTAGSVCYLARDLLFSGDTLFAGGYGRTDLPGGDDAALGASLARILALPDRKVFPGHGEATTIANEKRRFGRYF